MCANDVLVYLWIPKIEVSMRFKNGRRAAVEIVTLFQIRNSSIPFSKNAEEGRAWRDTETGGRGDAETELRNVIRSVSPRPRVPASPRHPVSPSPRLRVFVSQPFRIPVCAYIVWLPSPGKRVTPASALRFRHQSVWATRRLRWKASLL